jgi:hypothetical protein
MKFWANPSTGIRGTADKLLFFLQDFIIDQSLPNLTPFVRNAWGVRNVKFQANSSNKS